MRGTILVVDDDRFMARTLCAVLEKHGWTTSMVHSGEAAVLATQERTFAAILMDVKMPGMNGVQAFRTIRDRQDRVPVILMTAYAAQELLAEAERGGVLAILPKPLPWPQLLDLLSHAGNAPVLIVDDDVAFLKTIAAVVREHGWLCIETHSIADALAAAERHLPCVVLLDLTMPDSDPPATALAIKSRCPATMLVLCSGQPTLLAETMTGLPSGSAYAGLQKPFPPEQLLGMLDELRK